MPWFITSICSDKVYNKLRSDSKNTNYSRPQRTFGFFNTYVDALSAIYENRYNMQECLYDFIVLEYIESGIHALVLNTEWYKWTDKPMSNDNGKWECVEKCPKEFTGITNFALG